MATIGSNYQVAQPARTPPPEPAAAAIPVASVTPEPPDYSDDTAPRMPRHPLSFLRVFVKPLGRRKWDYVIRGTAVVAACGIPILLLFPDKTPLVTFALLAIPANGPLSPIIPVAFEPLILEAAKYEAPILVGLVGLCVYMYMEFLNWHLYGWVVHRDRLTGFRQSRVVKHGVRLFSVYPFITVILFALTPMPFWVVRVLALIRTYPIGRFMAATAIGRLPRLLLLAYLGAQLRPSTLLLAGILVTTSLVAILWARSKRNASESA